MRVSSVAFAAGLAALSISTSLHGQKADDRVDPRSSALVAKAEAARASGDLGAATGLLETALAVDPRNRAAVIALADVARAQQLPGKAIRYYREALALNPQDLHALRGQGEAMVMKGAVKSAQENLARIRAICAQRACSDATQLAAVIAKGPPITTASTSTKAETAATEAKN